MVREYMLDLGFNNNEIDVFISTYPLNNLKEETLYVRVRETFKLFKELGCKDVEIRKMLISFPSLCTLLITTIKSKIDELICFGYDLESIKKMVKKFPSIFAYKIEYINDRYLFFEKLGYTKNEFIKMTKLAPVILGLSCDTIQQKIDVFKEYGFEHNQILKITKSNPYIYGFSVETIKNKMEYIIGLGFDKAEIVNIIVRFPQVLALNNDNVSKKIDDMVDLGYTRKEVLIMIKALPNLFGLNIENIRKKKEFYDEIEISKYMVKDASNYMQSIELSYARYRFFDDMGRDVYKGNYKNLFMSQSVFKKVYGVSNDELLRRYDYNEYLTKKRKMV